MEQYKKLYVGDKKAIKNNIADILIMPIAWVIINTTSFIIDREEFWICMTITTLFLLILEPYCIIPYIIRIKDMEFNSEGVVITLLGRKKTIKWQEYRDIRLEKIEEGDSILYPEILRYAKGVVLSCSRKPYRRWKDVNPFVVNTFHPIDMVCIYCREEWNWNDYWDAHPPIIGGGRWGGGTDNIRSFALHEDNEKELRETLKKLNVSLTYDYRENNNKQV